MNFLLAAPNSGCFIFSKVDLHICDVKVPFLRNLNVTMEGDLGRGVWMDEAPSGQRCVDRGLSFSTLIV